MWTRLDDVSKLIINFTARHPVHREELVPRDSKNSDLKRSAQQEFEERNVKTKTNHNTGRIPDGVRIPAIVDESEKGFLDLRDTNVQQAVAIEVDAGNSSADENEKDDAMLRKQGWQCAMGPFPVGYSTPKSKNDVIIEQLEALLKTYGGRKVDDFKCMNLRTTIGRLKKWPKELRTTEDVNEFRKNCRKCGKKTVDKILEIIDSGQLQRVMDADTPEERARQLFVQVWGIGAKTAQKYVNMGYRTLDDLKKAPELKPIERIGVEFFEDIKLRIPREEAAAISKLVSDTAERLFPGTTCTTCGSYRRGKSNCGDVDIIITNEKCVLPFSEDSQQSKESRDFGERLFSKLVDELTRTSFLRHHLTASCGFGVGGFTFQRDNGSSHFKYMGLCKHPDYERHRRLDLIVVPKKEEGAALLYFTGSAYINRSMRALAKRKGLSLSQHGLKRDVVRFKGEKTHEGILIPGLDSEKDYFHALGLVYLKPEDRNL
eukprot:m.233686 g.233686  ORF g.233686 m.233686 type:complete len:488 (-) comp16028_c0_seq11:1933-3396(-)